MRGDLSALTKSAKKNHQNRLTHLCVTVVNRLGDSDELPISIYVWNSRGEVSFVMGLIGHLHQEINRAI